MTDHSAFLQGVQAYIEKNPEAAAYVADFVSRGIDMSRRAALERAADMEVALCLALSKRDKKHATATIISKLKKWNNNSALDWNTTIKELDRK